MSRRVHRNIKVLHDVYCNSQGHFEFFAYSTAGPFAVCDSGGGERLGKSGWDLWDVPIYVDNEVRRQVGELARAGKLHFYEHDRDGDKRYDNLRYVDQEHVEWIKTW